MKNAMLIVAALLLSIGANAQGQVIKDYFKKYSDNESFTKVTVSGKMFHLFTEMEGNTEAEKEFLEAAGNLKGLKVLTADSISNPKVLYTEACQKIDDAGYEELMLVEDANEEMKFAIIEKDGKIEELIMIMSGKNNFVLLSLYGEIDLKNISRVASAMRIEGLDHLSKIKDAENK